jgi:putative ABC transport system permease protein
MDRIAVLDTLIRNVRYAVRALRRSPAFTLVSLATLALGIGATTAMVTVVNSVVLRPLPYFEPQRLVTLWESNARYHFPGCPPGAFRFSPGDYLYLRDQSRSFQEIGGVAFEPVTLTGGAGPDRLMGGLASAGAFAALGVRPAAGRLLARADDSPSAERVVILSHEFWMERFGGGPAAIGSTLRLDNRLHTIIGVMPAGFQIFNQDADVWLPLERELAPENMRWHFSYYVNVIARLKAGIAIGQAREDADRIVHGVVRDFPGGIATGGMVVPLLDHTIAGARKPLLLFLGAVGFVLLIACANVANLHLARGISRRREIAMRLALGAGRARVIGELFTESMVLAIVGSAAGVGLAVLGVRALLHVAPDEIPRAAEVRIDAQVLAFTIVAATFSAILFGLWPAIASLARDPQQGIRNSTHRARTGLVVCEIALALVLSIGAGLMLESFRRVSAVDPGFDPRGLITMRVALSEDRYDTTEKQNAFYPPSLILCGRCRR